MSLTATSQRYRGIEVDAMTQVKAFQHDKDAASPDSLFMLVYKAAAAAATFTSAQTIGAAPYNANEMSGGNYKSGSHGYNATKGIPIVDPTYKLASGLIKFDAAACAQLTDQTWSAGDNCDCLAIYNDTIDDRVICVLAPGQMTVTAGTVDIDFDADGIYRIGA